MPTLERKYKYYGKQYDFVNDCNSIVGMIGGLGTGKSLALVGKAFQKCLEEPGAHGFLTAPTYVLLRDATLLSWWDIVPREMVDWSADELTATFKHIGYRGGSRVSFRSTSEPDRLRGPNLSFVGMDEAALTAYEGFKNLNGRLRLEDPLGNVVYIRQLFVTTTPRGFNWVWDIFNPEALKINPDRSFYHVKTYENPFLPLDYLQRLARTYGGPEDSFFRQEVLGEFVSPQGMVFPTFSREVHVGDYPINPKKPVILAVDFGYSNPYAVLAIQEDQNGRIFVGDEEYRLSTSDEEIVGLLKMKGYWGNIADCICDNAEPDRIQRLRAMGVPARASKKTKISEGIAKMRELLAVDPILKSPFLLVNKKCEETIKEFGLYRYPDPKDDKNTNEEPVDSYNHALSAIRYYVSTRYSRTALAQPDIMRPRYRRMAYQDL
jgi:PBSX family phage terminase large subunit